VGIAADVAQQLASFDICSPQEFLNIRARIHNSFCDNTDPVRNGGLQDAFCSTYQRQSNRDLQQALCYEALATRDAWWECSDARRDQKRCFGDNSDPGHDDAIQRRDTLASDCQSWYKNNCQ
jgi:hypothetical protein